jgi:hypothetical protein
MNTSGHSSDSQPDTFVSDLLECYLKICILSAYSGEVGRAFQSKPAGHSGGSRPPIPVIPATLVGA